MELQLLMYVYHYMYLVIWQASVGLRLRTTDWSVVWARGGSTWFFHELSSLSLDSHSWTQREMQSGVQKKRGCTVHVSYVRHASLIPWLLPDCNLQYTTVNEEWFVLPVETIDYIIHLSACHAGNHFGRKKWVLINSFASRLFLAIYIRISLNLLLSRYVYLTASVNDSMCILEHSYAAAHILQSQ